MSEHISPGRGATHYGISLPRVGQGLRSVERDNITQRPRGSVVKAIIWGFKDFRGGLLFHLSSWRLVVDGRCRWSGYLCGAHDAYQRE